MRRFVAADRALQRRYRLLWVVLLTTRGRSPKSRYRSREHPTFPGGEDDRNDWNDWNDWNDLDNLDNRDNRHGHSHSTMASVYSADGMDDTPIENESMLRGALIELLRPTDEAVLLPGAARSDASLTYKNIVMTLDGAARGIPFRAFGSDWGHGISVIRVPTEAAERAISSPARRAETLRGLVAAISNELVDSVEVGPRLGSLDNRDEEGDLWTEGFDGPNCCCGMYSANELRPVAGGSVGMTRSHKSYFLVAKAGAGRAGQEFHSRLSGIAADGASSLDSLMLNEGSPMSETVLERVVASGRRNRARLLLVAANVFGLAPDVDSVPDHACCEGDSNRGLAILMADSVTNMLERVPTTAADAGSLWRYHAGSISAGSSQGAIACSNVSEGLVLFLPAESDEAAMRIRNSAHGSLPFGSKRIASTLEALRAAANAHHATINATGDEGRSEDDDAAAHPDDEWVNSRFAWKTPTLRRTTATGAAEMAKVIEPPQLWGTHAPLESHTWARAMGAGALRHLHLSPEAVALSGTESSVLRAAIGRVLG